MKKHISGIKRAFILFLAVCMTPALIRFAGAQPPTPEKKAGPKAEQVQKPPVNMAAEPLADQASDKEFEGTISETSKELAREMKTIKNKQLYISALKTIDSRDMPAAKAKLDAMISNPDITKEERSVLYQHRGLANIALDDVKAAGYDLDQAIATLEAVKELTPGKKFALANSHYGKGVIAYGESRFKDALEDFDSALKVRPVNYIHIMKCDTLINLGKHEEAAKAYEDGIAFSPKFKKESKAVCLTLKEHGKGPKSCD